MKELHVETFAAVEVLAGGERDPWRCDAALYQRAEYLGALEQYRLEALHEPRVLKMFCWLVDYPFALRLPKEGNIMMNDLLASIIDAHGGVDRWNEYEKVNARCKDIPRRDQ